MSYKAIPTILLGNPSISRFWGQQLQIFPICVFEVTPFWLCIWLFSFQTIVYCYSYPCWFLHIFVLITSTASIPNNFVWRNTFSQHFHQFSSPLFFRSHHNFILVCCCDCWFEVQKCLEMLDSLSKTFIRMWAFTKSANVCMWFANVCMRISNKRSHSICELCMKWN